MQLLVLVFDGVSFGHQRTILWSLLNFLACSKGGVVDLLALFLFDDDRVLIAGEHFARDELLTFKQLATILLVPLRVVLDEVDAVELALLVDHVVALELIDLTCIAETLECVDAQFQIAILHVLSIPVRNLMELK